MHNNVVAPLTLLVKVARDANGRAGFDAESLRTAVALIDLREKARSRELSEGLHIQAAESLEHYLRRMLSRCALRIHIPYSGEVLPGPKQLKPLLAPSVKKTVRFVDRSERSWHAIIAYLEPVSSCFANEDLSSRLAVEDDICRLAWDTYLLILATKCRAEVVLQPQNVLRIIQAMSTYPLLSSEAKARLAVLEGLFNCFSRPVETQAFKFLPNVPSFAISERIHEILEDAYLLEASRLRRLLGIQANIASIQRDLRKLLSFIQQRRSWAKGIVSLSSDVIVGAKVPMAFLEKVTELLPELSNTQSYPVLTVDPQLLKADESTIRFMRMVSGGSAVTLDP